VVAKSCSHTLGMCHPVDEQRLHAFPCEVCRAMR
jgi:hypothetical protein